MADANRSNLPVDPDVKVPAAVKAAAARAEQIHAEAYQTNGTGPDAGAKAGANPPNGESSGGPRSPAETNQPGEPAAAPPAPAQPEPRPVQPSREPQAPSAGRADSGRGDQRTEGNPPVEDWEQKFRSTQGRQRQLEHENRALASRLAGMEATMAALNSAPPTAPAQGQPFNPDLQFRSSGRPTGAPPASLPKPDQFQLTAEERADYGEEFLSVIDKRAAATVLPYVEQVRQENEHLRRQLAQVGANVNQNAKSTVMAFMDQNLPDWREINHDPKFLEWLGLTDPYSGVRKQDMLTAAYERNDAHRVLAFFNGFLSDEAAVAPANPQPNGNGHQPPKIPLENFAAPGRAKTAAGGSAPAEKPTISRSQITEFYAQVANGKFRGNDAEKNRLEGMIFEAQREGRIVQ